MPIEIKDLTYIYMKGTPFETAALRDINITLEKGDFTGLIGHTGSGKSTLVQHINGLLKPTSGMVLVDGVNVAQKTREAREARSKVGMVFQYPEHQLFEETVALDVAFGPKNMGFSGDELEGKVKRAIEKVGLSYDDIKDRSPFELSGGQKRRVAIAGVVAMEPDHLILDEPTAGLDPKGRDELISLVKDLQKNDGVGILMVTHSMNDIARAASRILVLNDSTIVMDGAPSEVFERVDELERIGLGVPDMSKLRSILAKKGISLPREVFEAELAAKLLAEEVRGIAQ